jgi:hypothetical protein
MFMFKPIKTPEELNHMALHQWFVINCSVIALFNPRALKSV